MRSAGPGADELASSLADDGERAASLDAAPERAGPGLPYEAGVGLPTSSPAIVSLFDVKADKVRTKKRVGRLILSFWQQYYMQTD